MKGKKCAIAYVMVCCLVLGVWGNGFGQGVGRLSGRVTDSETNEPIVGVKVYLIDEDLHIDTVTGKDGYYVFSNIAQGLCKLVFSHAGYRIVEVSKVKIYKGLTTLLSQAMDSTDLDEVEQDTIRVEYKKPALEFIHHDFKKITDKTRPDSLIKRGKIAGRVIDKETKEPLSSVNILVTGGGYRTGTFTGVDGDYVIAGVPPGKYKVEFSIIGYKISEIENIEVKSDSTTQLDVQMEPEYLRYLRREMEYEEPPRIPVNEEVEEQETDDLTIGELSEKTNEINKEVPIGKGRIEGRVIERETDEPRARRRSWRTSSLVSFGASSGDTTRAWSI